MGGFYIVKKSKYSKELKLSIVKRNLDDKGSTATLAKVYMTGGESHSVRYMRATTKPLVRATSFAKRASPYRLAS